MDGVGEVDAVNEDDSDQLALTLTLAVGVGFGVGDVSIDVLESKIVKFRITRHATSSSPSSVSRQ